MATDTPQAAQALRRSKAWDVVIARGGAVHRLAKLIFASDGGLYIHCIGYPHTNGVVTVRRIGSGVVTESVELGGVGAYSVSHVVKYSHHRSGMALFSLDGKVKSFARRQALPLDVQRGHLCSLSVAPVSSFAPFRRKANSVEVRMDLPADRDDVKLVFYRYSLHDSASWVGTDSDGRFVRQFPSGNTAQLACGPAEYPMADIAVAVAARPSDVTSDRPYLLFVGGFDRPDSTRNSAQDLEFLMYAYPIDGDVDAESIDLESGVHT